MSKAKPKVTVVNVVASATLPQTIELLKRSYEIHQEAAQRAAKLLE